MKNNRLYRLYAESRFFRIIAQLLVVITVYMSVRYWQSQEMVRGLAPVSSAVTLNNEVIELAPPLEKPVLVHFWASWCPVCKFENSNIASLSEDYAVITVASWSGAAEEVAQYVETESLDMPVVVDEDGEWAKLYGVKGVPASFFVGTDGQIEMIEKGYTTEIGLRFRMWWIENM